MSRAVAAVDLPIMRTLIRDHLPSGRTLPPAEWERRHRAILVLLWALAVALPAYGVARGHAVAHDIGGAIALLVIAALASRAHGRRATASALAALGLCIASALAVHLADGAIEAHFTFFVMIIVVSLYEDWRPFLVAVGFVVLHHGTAGVIDRASVYDHPGNPWMLAAIHGAFVLAASIAAIVSWRLNEDLRAEARHAHAQAGRSDARFRSAFDDGPVAMMLIGASGRSRGVIARVNRTLCRQFGYSAAELTGSHMSVVLDDDGEERILAAIDELLAGRSAQLEDEFALRDRAEQPFEGRLSMSLVVGDRGVQDVIVQIEDVTERNRLACEVREHAELDPLTGLRNRGSFERELSGWLGSPNGADRGGAVILVDLDNFREVNDSLGLRVGDGLLLATSRALMAHTREADIVARVGGDEFALLIPAVLVEQAAAVGAALVARIAEHAVSSDVVGVRRTTASVGVFVHTGIPELSADELLGAADLAMDAAKAAGGNRCVVHAASEGSATADVTRISSPGTVMRALDEDRLTLYAQPIVDLHTGTTSRYELLVRMLGADGEVIAPGAFLPTAERRGTIRWIDRWVVREAIKLLHERPYGSEALRVHVNISARSLADPGFYGFLSEVLVDASIEPAALVLEVTETAAIANLGDARNLLTRLSALGCGVALDDFGAGFACFHYLKHLPFDQLKIDGEFIRDLTTNPDDLLLVETLVQMARGLGKRTVAERVEDAATLKLLRDVGVDFAQGYHLGRPAPALQVLAQTSIRAS